MNPYLNRAMIRNSADFFGRSSEVTRILSRAGADPPQSVSIVGERRIGKTFFPVLLWLAPGKGAGQSL